MTRTCNRCGADLPVPTQPNEPQIRCAYCGTFHSNPLATPAAAPAPFAPPQAPCAPPAPAWPAAPPPMAYPNTSRVGVAPALWIMRGIVPLIIAVFVMIRAFGRVAGFDLPFASLHWDGMNTLICAGNQHATISNVTANLWSGTGIVASGNCQLTLADCNVSAQTALVVSGNAHVTLRGGKLLGNSAAIIASENAVVSVQGTQVAGQSITSANAQILNGN